MCVIFLVESDDKPRPSEDMVAKAWTTNSHGGGVAWRETVNGTTTVRWAKGLSLEQMQKLNKTLPFPYVLHFRIPSHGTPLRAAVCHPFPMEEGVSLALNGSTSNGVLFHNGMWTGWKDKLLDSSIKGGWKLPTDSWSDSRGLAWMAHHCGLGFLELVNEKVIAFGPDFCEVYGDGWEKIDDVWCSNKLWVHRTVSGFLPGVGQTTRQTPSQGITPVDDLIGKAGGPSHQASFRPPCHYTGSVETKAGGEGNEPESLQESCEGAPFWGEEGRPSIVEVEITDTDGSLAFMLVDDPTPKKCADCGSTKAGNITEGVRRCWQCWSTFNAIPVKQGEPTYICESCSTHQKVMLTVDEGEWICSPCWVKAGKPDVVGRDGNKGTFDERLAQRRADRLKGIQIVGSM